LENKEDIVGMIKKVKNGSERAGLKLYLRTTNIMNIWEQVSIVVGCAETSTITS
jgi:hypothetical protein